MKKTPSLTDANILKQLTEARELAALGRLHVAAAARKSAADEVHQLQQTDHAVTNAEEAEVVSKWREWRSQELIRRNVRLAAAEAEYRSVAHECGRYVAENSVADRLRDAARDSKKRDRDAW